MLFLEFFAMFLHERFLEIWLGQETDKWTDGRTYPEGKKICLPQRETYNTLITGRCHIVEQISKTLIRNNKLSLGKVLKKKIKIKAKFYFGVF